MTDQPVTTGYVHSASRVKTLNDCQKLFYHKYILQDLLDDDGPYAMLGTALHKVLEIWRPNPTLSRREMVGLFNQHFPLGNKHYLFKEGCSIIYGLETNRLIRGDLVSTEFEFDLTFNGRPVKGIIDKIERTGENKLLVTDYKSNKTIVPEEYIHQLAIYDAALEQKFPGTEREHELYFLRFNKSVPFKFTKESWDKVDTIFASIDNLIVENQDKPGNWAQLPTQTKVCSFCPLKSECWR